MKLPRSVVEMLDYSLQPHFSCLLTLVKTVDTKHFTKHFSTLATEGCDTLHVRSRKTNVDNSSSMSTWVKWSLAMPLNVWLYLGRGDPIRLMCIPSSVNRKWDRNTDRVGDTNRDELTQNSVTPGDSTEKMPTNHYTLE